MSTGCKPSKFNVMVQATEGDSWYLYNTYSQALLEVPETTWPLVQSIMRQDEVPADPLEQKVHDDYARRVLRPGGFVVLSDVDEIDYLRAQWRVSEAQTLGFGLSIAPTMACNLDCPYCYAAKTARGRMSREVEQALERFVEAQLATDGTKVMGVSWLGGEPLMCLDTMVRLTRAFRKAAEEHGVEYVRAGLISNGTLITREVARSLRDDCNVNFLQLTMDGFQHDERRRWKGAAKREKVSCLQRVLRGYHHMKPLIDRVAVRINVDTQNADVDELARFVDMLVAEGVEKGEIHLAPVTISTEAGRCYQVPVLRMPDFARFEIQWRARLGLPEKRPERRILSCGLKKRRSYTVDPEGYLSCCWQYMGVSARRMGHVTTGLYADSPCRDFFNLHPFNREECLACELLPICVGGCPAERIASAETDPEHACIRFRWDTEDRIRRIAAGAQTSPTCQVCTS